MARMPGSAARLERRGTPFAYQSAESPRQEQRKCPGNNHLQSWAGILAAIRIWLNQRPLRPERLGMDSQVLDTQGLASSEITACPQSCPDCRQAETIQDNSGRDSEVLIRSLLRAVQDGGDDGTGERRNMAKGTSKSLLEVIRLLVEMDPEERTALLGLLKALG